MYRYRSAAAAYFLNRHIGAESIYVALNKVEMVEMSFTQSQANPLLALLGSGCLVHSVPAGFSHVKPVDLLCL